MGKSCSLFLGFGSKKTYQPLADSSSLVYTTSSTSQDLYSREGPLPGSRQSGHRDTGAGLYTTPEGSEASHLDEYSELVWIHLPDLGLGHSFSYQQGAQVFMQDH